jgi:putative PIN family toxin of toxin-antitoxin system
MRLVVDTNVFVSILIRPGQTLSAFAEYLDRACVILYSTDTLTELVDILRRRKFAAYTSAEEVAAFVEWVINTGELVATEGIAVACRDPKDEKFVAVALAGRADYLISGDQDLLVLGRVGSTPIVSPAALLALVNQ